MKLKGENVRPEEDTDELWLPWVTPARFPKPAQATYRRSRWLVPIWMFIGALMLVNAVWVGVYVHHQWPHWFHQLDTSLAPTLGNPTVVPPPNITTDSTYPAGFPGPSVAASVGSTTTSKAKSTTSTTGKATTTSTTKAKTSTTAKAKTTTTQSNSGITGNTGPVFPVNTTFPQGTVPPPTTLPPTTVPITIPTTTLPPTTTTVPPTTTTIPPTTTTTVAVTTTT